MSTKNQIEYISDMAVKKTKEFKEVKELIIANNISSGDIVKNAQSLAEIVNALTDTQASKLIEVLIAKDEPKRDRTYTQKRIEKANSLLEDIKAQISSWRF